MKRVPLHHSVNRCHGFFCSRRFNRVCPICLETSSQTMMFLPCGHQLHRDCSTNWFNRSSSCPICRMDVPEVPASPMSDTDGLSARRSGSWLVARIKVSVESRPIFPAISDPSSPKKPLLNTEGTRRVLREQMIPTGSGCFDTFTGEPSSSDPWLEHATAEDEPEDAPPPIFSSQQWSPPRTSQPRSQPDITDEGPEGPTPELPGFLSHRPSRTVRMMMDSTMHHQSSRTLSTS